MSDFPIQPYDIFMLAVLALTTIFGAWKGMAWQLASLASVVVSIFVAMNFSGVVAPMFSDQEWARFAAMLVLYLLTSLGIWLVFRLVAGVIDRVKLKEWDRQVGAIFGFAKGVTLCLVVTFFAVTLSESARQAVLNAHSGRATAFLIEQGRPLMPAEVDRVFGKYIDKFDEKLDPATPADPPKMLPTLPPRLPDFDDLPLPATGQNSRPSQSASLPERGRESESGIVENPGESRLSDRT